MIRHQPSAKSKPSSPRKYGLCSILQPFKAAGLAWVDDNVLRLSAAMSYYTVLSLGPIIVIVIRFMGVGHAGKFARQQLTNQVAYLMGPRGAAAIKPIIDSTSTHPVSAWATAFSTIVLLFSSTSVFIELRDSMNSIWGVKPRESNRHPVHHAAIEFLRTRLFSLVMVFAMGFILVLSMFIGGFYAGVEQRIAQVNKGPAVLVDIGISLALETALFGAIFHFLPRVKLRWRDVWHGALIAAVLFSIGRLALGVYFKYGRSSNAYGAVGSLVAVLSWVYYSSFSLFFGAEFTKVCKLPNAGTARK